MSSRNAGFNSFTLPAGESIHIPAHAEFLRCLEATAPFEFNIDDGGWQYMAAGISYVSDNPNGFNTFRVRSSGVFDNALVLAHGWGELRDDRLQVSGIVNTFERLPNAISPGFVQTIPPLSAITLVSAEDARRKMTIKNLGAVTVWFGNSVAEYGHPLAPGEIFETTNAGLVSCYNGKLTAGKLSVLIERVT